VATSKATTTEFAARIRSIGVAAEKAQRKGVESAALMLKRSIEAQTSIATKGSMGFSNMDRTLTRTGRLVPSRGTSKLRVGYDIVGERNPTALLVARGPWGLIEYGSVEHVITPRMSAIQRKGVARKAYLRATTQRRLDMAYNAVGVFSGYSPMNGASGGGTPRYRVMHSGTKGKRPFKRGIDLVRDLAARRATSLISNEIVTTVRANSRQMLYIRGETGAIVTKSGSVL
jgi:hypothetical protein